MMHSRKVKEHGFVLFPLFFLFWTLPRLGAQNLPPQVISYPETVVVNGKVLTADDQFSLAEAFAVRDGKFLAVGSNSLIRQMVGPQTRVIDVKGKTVVPGFIDAHQHIPVHSFVGIFMERPDLQWDAQMDGGMPVLHWESPEQILRNVKKAVAVTPPGGWVALYHASATEHIVRLVKRSQLDAVSPSHPVALVGAAGQLQAVNSVALTKIPKGTPGAPQGDEATISGDTADLLLDDLVWSVPLEKKLEAIQRRMVEFNALGVTTIATKIWPPDFTLVREIHARKGLTLRWRVGLEQLIERLSGSSLERAVRRLPNLTDVGDDWLRITGFAAGAADGSAQSGSGWTFQPRLRSTMPGTGVALRSSPYGARGLEDRWPGQEMLTLFVQYGWSVSNSHSVGDRSTYAFLQAYEEGAKRRILPATDQKLTIDHLTMVRPEDIRKFKELGVSPGIGPWFIYQPPNADYLVHYYGEERVNQMMPVKSYILAGLKPGAQSDMDRSPYRDPLWNMQVFITRKDWKGRVWNRKEAVSRQEALWMYTLWNATQRGDEKMLGSIEPGKLADWVVLERDYMTVPEDEISKIPVVMTVVGGKPVYDKLGGL